MNEVYQPLDYGDDDGVIGR